MPRIRMLGIDDVAADTRRWFENDLERHGRIMPSSGIYGYAPTILEGAKALDAGITNAGGITKQLRFLVNVRVAQMVGCPF